MDCGKHNRLRRLLSSRRWKDAAKLFSQEADGADVHDVALFIRSFPIVPDHIPLLNPLLPYLSAWSRNYGLDPVVRGRAELAAAMCRRFTVYSSQKKEKIC